MVFHLHFSKSQNTNELENASILTSNVFSIRPKISENITYTGDSRYVDFAYLDTITYVEVIFHSQHFCSIYLCISTPSMSKTVNMKQRVSRGDFSCPNRIFYYIYYWVCRSKNLTFARASYCLLRLSICNNWGAKIFQTIIKNNLSDITSFDWAINPLFSAIKSIHCFDTKSHLIPIA